MNIELLKIGMEKHRSKDYVNSIKIFNQAIEDDPTDSMTFNLYLAIGEGKYNLTDYQGSVDAYTKGLNFYKENITLFNQQPAQLIEQTKGLITHAYRIRGNGKKELQDNQGAVQDFTKSIELDSQLSESFYSRGVVYIETGNFTLAQQDFLKVIELKPNDPLAYRNLGNSKFQLGDFKSAIFNYTKALNLSIPIEHQGEVYNNRGSAKGALGDYQNALLDFEKSLSINPNDLMGLENKRALLSHLSKL